MVDKDAPFGTGIGLDGDFDLETDSTGDLNTDSGMEELEKDLSLLIAFRAKRVSGMRFSDEDKSRIRVKSRSALKEDERVLDVSHISVERHEDDSDLAVIKAEVLTITGQVITLSTQA